MTGIANLNSLQSRRPTVIGRPPQPRAEVAATDR